MPRAQRAPASGALWRIVAAVLVVVAAANLMGMVLKTQSTSQASLAPQGRVVPAAPGPRAPPAPAVVGVTGPAAFATGVNFSQVHKSRRNHVVWGPGPVNASTAACVPQALDPAVDCRCVAGGA